MFQLKFIPLYCVLVAVTYGLEFQPTPPHNENELIWYKASDEKNTLYWRNKLDEFLTPYTNPRTEGSHFIECQQGEPPKKGSGSVCDVKINNWGSCVSSLGYNFNTNKEGPCIFLKPDKILDWIPEYYNASTVPDSMPKYLKEHITRTQARFGPSSNELKNLWVSCDGENPADKENIGPISYYPKLGFDGQYFPVENADHYLSPLVAVHFHNPMRGILIFIECKVWAKNIVHDSSDKRGSVRFELMVDY